MTPRLSPRAVWLTLHEPRTVTAGFVLAYLVIAWGGVGALSIRAARLAAGRTQTAETLPGA